MIRRLFVPLVLGACVFPLAAFSATPLALEPKATLSIPDPHYDIVEGVAMDGDYLVMGALRHLDGDNGPSTDVGVFLFQRQASGTWAPLQTLFTDNGSIGLSPAVALRGNLLAAFFSGRLRVYERTASGWQSSPVDPQYTAYNPPWIADLEISGTTILLGSGAPGFGCDRYQARALRKNSSGVWVPVGNVASSDPATDASCFQSDVSTSGQFTALAADTLANGTSAAYIFPGSLGNWSAPVRFSGQRSPVALENGTALLSGSAVFRFSGGSWIQTQTLQRPDRLLMPPITAELRNKLAVIGYGRPTSVFEADANNTFSEVARLIRPGGEERSAQVDISGRRVALGGIDEAKAFVYELPTSFVQPAQIQDTFESGNAAAWTPIAGSSWSVIATPASRVYRQTSLAGDAGSFRTNMDWTNQSIQADVTPTAFSGNDRWVGLAVRRANPTNYYYITARSSNVLQLKRMVNGAFQTLASTSLPVTLNTTYRLRLEAVGTTIRAFVNDQLLLQAVDSSISHGQAGLLMYRAAANYDNVVVTPSQQVTTMADVFQYTTAPHWTPVTGTWSTPPVYAQGSTAGDALSVTGVATGDQSMQARAHAVSYGTGGDPWFGLFARYQGPGNYYYVTVRSSNSISLRRLTGGSIQVLDSAPLPVSLGTWYSLRLEAIGNQLRVYVNGTLVLEATDSTFQQGRYGVVTYKTAAEFDDVLVTQP
jgi:hypothetical protein